jgi:hypothetical protein
LLECFEQADERMFMLTGGHVTGKSMIMVWLSTYGPTPADPEAAERLARIRRFVKAGHFCVADGD